MTKVTIKDVATAAGVSVATVSYVLIETIDGSQTVRKLVFQPTLIPIEAGQFEPLS